MRVRSTAVLHCDALRPRQIDLDNIACFRAFWNLYLDFAEFRIIQHKGVPRFHPFRNCDLNLLVCFTLHPMSGAGRMVARRRWW